MSRMLVQTERLELRELCADDMAFLVEVLGHPEVMHYWPKPYSSEGARQWFEKQQRRYTNDGCGYWLAVERVQQLPVGFAGVMTVEIDGEPDYGLGWIIHQPYQRRGYATEAARGCLKFAMEQLGLERVVAPIRPENEASIGVALKLGMVVEKQTTFAGFDHLIYVNR